MVVRSDGTIKQGSKARVEPEGEVMRMWEAIETYMNRKQPLIIVAGKDYGQVQAVTGLRKVCVLQV